MKNLYIISILVFSILTFSCKKEKEQTNNADKLGKEPKVYVMFIDGTASYKFLAKAKQTISGIIRNAPSGSTIFVHWITENSNSDKYSIVSAKLPDLSTGSSSPYKNSKTKQTEKKLLNQDISIRNQLIQQLNNAKSPNAKRTDIYGAIFAASERFENYQKQGVLMVFSDLDDNVNNKYQNLSLNGASVMILDFQTDKKGENKRFWAEKFNEIGASNVEFRHTDELITFK